MKGRGRSGGGTLAARTKCGRGEPGAFFFSFPFTLWPNKRGPAWARLPGFHSPVTPYTAHRRRIPSHLAPPPHSFPLSFLCVRALCHFLTNLLRSATVGASGWGGAARPWPVHRRTSASSTWRAWWSVCGRKERVRAGRGARAGERDLAHRLSHPKKLTSRTARGSPAAVTGAGRTVSRPSLLPYTTSVR